MDNTEYEDSMGRHAPGEGNKYAKKFSNLFVFNEMVIGVTIIPHQHIHKASLISPDHIAQNQIDHICVSEKLRRTLEDISSRRGADIVSDHHLVVAKMKRQLKNTELLGKRQHEGSVQSYMKQQWRTTGK